MGLIEVLLHFLQSNSRVSLLLNKLLNIIKIVVLKEVIFFLFIIFWILLSRDLYICE